MPGGGCEEHLRIVLACIHECIRHIAEDKQQYWQRSTMQKCTYGANDH